MRNGARNKEGKGNKRQGEIERGAQGEEGERERERNWRKEGGAERGKRRRDEGTKEETNATGRENGG